MTPDELREILDRLEWTQGDLARRLHRNPSRVRKMCRGREEVDPETARWLRTVDRQFADVQTLAETPPPRPAPMKGPP